jgi:hypothetical protein
MGLVDLRTDLKSLRFGKDRVGGGSSGQPYKTRPIPDSLSDTNVTGGPDFLLRGGTLALRNSVRDVSRLSQMFFDFKSPNGLLFTAKQNILSRTAVATQASGILNEGAYLPTSTLAQAGVNALGIHLNKQGLDPTKRTGPQAGQKGIFDLLNINDPLGLPIYSEHVTKNQPKDENRLVELTKNKISSTQSNSLGVGGVGKNNISLDNGNLLEYPGGPGSILGIGKTTIKRYDNTSNNLDFNEIGNTNFKNQNFITLNSSQIESQVSTKYDPQIKDFRRDLTPPNPEFSNLPNSLDYTNFNNRLEKRVNLGNPGTKGNKSSYQTGKIIGGQPQGPLDKINALPLYKSDSVVTDKIKNDLVKFRIGVIDNNNPRKKTYIHFRAFIDDYSDSYNASWNSENYIGRGDKIYRYGGFDRSINLSWTVAAQSKDELIPMYQKLNYLASVSAPDYSPYGYMRGNLITLTVGGWLHEQVGFIEGITYTVPQESPWEIAIPDGTGTNLTEEGISTDPSVKEMPMIIKVSGFKFTPIQSFLPQIQQNNFDGGATSVKGMEKALTNGNFIKSFGNERYIQLSNGRDLEKDITGETIPNAGVAQLNNYGDSDGRFYNGNTNYIPLVEN